MPEPSAISSVPHIGTYRRELPVSLERMYENTIDWAHLPYVHRSSFARIECVRADASGFQAWVWPRRIPEGPPFLLELTLDRQLRRWISRTIDGPGTGSEIWTRVIPLDERWIEITVDFFVPDVQPERLAATREFYTSLYARLYDEDVAMMTLRQTRLDEAHREPIPREARRQSIGVIDEVRGRLPLIVEAPYGNKFKIVAFEGRLVAYSTVCPHLLGPLDECEVAAGIVECPWHGYRYDVRTRECVSGARCHLGPVPAIEVDRETGEVMLDWNRGRS